MSADRYRRVFLGLSSLLFRTSYTDVCYGYNAFWRDVLPALAIPNSRAGAARWGDGFEIETLINCRVATSGLQMHEVPSVELERIHGESATAAPPPPTGSTACTTSCWRWPVAERRPRVRRSAVVVACLLLLASLLSACSFSVRGSSSSSGFVTRSGSSFHVKGEPFRFVGFNLYDAAAGDIYSCSPSTRLDDDALAKAMRFIHDKAGATVVRFWA